MATGVSSDNTYQNFLHYFRLVGNMYQKWLLDISRPLSPGAMGRIIFHKPLLVQRGRIDRDRIILSARDAAEFLLRDWPTSGCPKHERAMKACLDVIRGIKPPSHARRAFADAARQAGILLDDWSQRPPLPTAGRRSAEPGILETRE
jgi:hypothetical protein